VIIQTGMAGGKYTCAAKKWRVAVRADGSFSDVIEGDLASETQSLLRIIEVPINMLPSDFLPGAVFAKGLVARFNTEINKNALTAADQDALSIIAGRGTV